MQRQMPLPGEARKPELVPVELLQCCRHRLDAIRLCMQLSSLTHAYIAERLTIDPGHLSRVLSGQAHFPDTKSVQLMELCGNLAPVQWEMMAMGISGDAPLPKRRNTDFGGRRQPVEETRRTA